MDSLRRSDGPEQEEDFLVWPENWLAVRVFLALSTQWQRQIDGFSGTDNWYGLRYEAIEPVLRLMAIPSLEWPDIFGRLRIMEGSALRRKNERIPS